MLKVTLDDLKGKNFKVFELLKTLGLLKVEMFYNVTIILTWHLKGQVERKVPAE